MDEREDLAHGIASLCIFPLPCLHLSQNTKHTSWFALQLNLSEAKFRFGEMIKLVVYFQQSVLWSVCTLPSGAKSCLQNHVLSLKSVSVKRVFPIMTVLHSSSRPCSVPISVKFIDVPLSAILTSSPLLDTGCESGGSSSGLTSPNGLASPLSQYLGLQ